MVKRAFRPLSAIAAALGRKPPSVRIRPGPELAADVPIEEETTPLIMTPDSNFQSIRGMSSTVDMKRLPSLAGGAALLSGLPEISVGKCLKYIST